MKDAASIVSKVTNLQMLRPFHYRNFSLLYLGTIAMAMGEFMLMVAIGWLVLEITDSPLSVGIAWATHSAPYLIFGMLAGAVADKVDRRRLLIWAFIILAASAFTIGFLVSKDRIQLWHILLSSFIMASIRTFAMPARQAFIVDIVGKKDAMSAISMNAVAMRGIGVFGGALGGVVIELLGIAWPFYIIVIGCLLGIIALLCIRGVVRETGPEQQSIRENFVEGLKIIGKNKTVRILMVMAIIADFFGFSHMAVLPIFARDVLKVGAIGLGMLSAVRSAGGLLGGLALASLGDYKHKGWLILGIFLLFGIFLVLFAQSPWYPVSLLFMGMVGTMATTFDAMQHTLLQLNVTDKQRGRAMGIWQLSISVGPASYMTIGAIASLLGAPLAVSINGIAIVAIFFILVAFVPRLRKI